MKQRIISGIVMGAIVALVLILGLNIDGIIITIFLAAIAAIATWELTFNALGIKWLPFQIIPMVYTAGSVWIVSSWLSDTMVDIFRLSGWARPHRSGTDRNRKDSSLSAACTQQTVQRGVSRRRNKLYNNGTHPRTGTTDRPST